MLMLHLTGMVLSLNRGPIRIRKNRMRNRCRAISVCIWEDEKPGMVVKSVLDGSGGSVAGLMPGDEILAIGGERLNRDNLEKLMTSFSPGEETHC